MKSAVSSPEPVLRIPGRMNSPMQPSSSASERPVPGSLPSGGEGGGPGLIDAQREQLLNGELAAARMNAGPKGRSGAFLRTVCYVLVSAVCYYVATRIA